MRLFRSFSFAAAALLTLKLSATAAAPIAIPAINLPGGSTNLPQLVPTQVSAKLPKGSIASLYLGGSKIGTNLTAAPYSFTFSPTNLGPAALTLTATNTTTHAFGSKTVYLNFIHDTNIPSVTVISPAPGAKVSRKIFIAKGTISDNTYIRSVGLFINDNVTNVNNEVLFFAKKETVAKVRRTSQGLVWSAKLKKIQRGPSTLVVMGRDGANNISYSYIPILLR